MSQIVCPAKHAGECANRFYFHARAGAAAVERMVVGIDPHGERISGAGQGMRWLEHLPGIKGMKVGVVVRHSLCHLAQHGGHGVDCRLLAGLRRGQIAKGCFELWQGTREKPQCNAAFLNESRTRGHLWCRVAGNPGCARDDNFVWGVGWLLRALRNSPGAAANRWCEGHPSAFVVPRT